MERVPNIEIPNLELKYTFCFLKRGDKILMIHRFREPNKDLWNGIGGKLEPGETPFEGILREIKEEADIDVPEERVHFSGLITWPKQDPTHKAGMYAFLVTLDETQPITMDDRTIDEGVLSWKDATWASNPFNHEVVENIPHFLPYMLQSGAPMEYFCDYNDVHDIRGIKVLPLPTRA